MTKQSKGGITRAKLLSDERRKEIATIAAKQRWNNELPVTESEGPLYLGEQELSCVVLPDETRVISQSTFLKAIGRSRSFRGGTGVSSTEGEAPFFMQSETFRPYESDIAKMPFKPIKYKTKSGKTAVGYNALLLPRVAELYLKIRDDYHSKHLRVPVRLQDYIRASDVLIRGLADVGIIALIDEATGYQNKRAKDSLSKILEKFIAKELRPWVKTFPDEFYDHLFRLRDLEFPRDIKKKTPQYFGHITNDIVYSRLAPGVLQELKEVSAKSAGGNRKHKLHQRLTGEVGHPALREYLSSVITLMKISPDFDRFMVLLDQVHPKYSSNLQLPLGDTVSQLTNNSSKS